MLYKTCLLCCIKFIESLFAEKTADFVFFSDFSILSGLSGVITGLNINERGVPGGLSLELCLNIAYILSSKVFFSFSSLIFKILFISSIWVISLFSSAITPLSLYLRANGVFFVFGAWD